MPLEAGAKEGTPGFGRNVATEIKAGKDPKQAEAIAYSVSRGDKLDAIADAAGRLDVSSAASAYASGKKREDNPHPVGSLAADRWNTDFTNAQRKKRGGAENGFKADALQPNPWANKIAALEGGVDSLTARLARNDAKDEPDAIKEAAKKAGMSVEDYLAQRKKSNMFHLRETQRREMSI